MHPRTIANLDELENTEWFSRVGIRDAEIGVVLGSWQEAIAHCTDPAWERLCVQQAHRYVEGVGASSPESFSMWDDVLAEVEKAAVPLVNRKIKHPVQKYKFPKKVIDLIRMDIVFFCMEAEYADIYPAGFYWGKLSWYLNGHFPCGWQGEFPSGVPIVY